MRTDNGSEFCNAVVASSFRTFGTMVLTRAVRHPESQGSAEHFSCTFLTLIRKTIDDSLDWKEDLEILLHHYHMQPHCLTGMAPMEAMVGWMPQ